MNASQADPAAKRVAPCGSGKWPGPSFWARWPGRPTGYGAPVLIVLMLGIYGCQSLSYGLQAAAGQIDMLSRRRPITRLLADPGLDSRLRQRLERVTAIRAFAAESLHLPVDGQFTAYADLKRPFAVWVVFAAPEFDLAPRTWCFPVVGCVAYLGYFAEKDARKRAASLEADGWETYVAGVRAYSTLGWFADPVLNTFVNAADADLAGIIFHELAHGRLYVADDTAFNESFAVAVEREGVRRWLQDGQRPAVVEAYEASLARQDAFTALVLAARAELEALYARTGPTVETARRKRAIVTRMRRDYDALKTSWNGYSGYDAWMAGPLNNAQLNSVAAYHSLRDGFASLLADCGGDLQRFYAACEQLADQPLAQRHARLTGPGHVGRQ